MIYLHKSTLVVPAPITLLMSRPKRRSRTGRGRINEVYFFTRISRRVWLIAIQHRVVLHGYSTNRTEILRGMTVAPNCCREA